MLSVLLVALCVLLTAAILIQNSKGGLNSGFSKVYQLVSVKRGSVAIEKMTWILAVGLLFVNLLLSR
jgi:protein translocase SecG subunit